jgi:hypothetical protein
VRGARAAAPPPLHVRAGPSARSARRIMTTRGLHIRGGDIRSCGRRRV